MADYTDFIRHNLQRFQGAEAYLPAHNSTFGNPDFQDASCRVLIARLSPLRDVDRSIPHLFLFQEVRRALPRAYVDLGFFPSLAERLLYEEEGIPPLIGVQSLHSVEDFDLVLFTNAYTLELINLPYVLLRSSLPLWSSERGPGGPILVLGGSNAMASQAVVRANGDSLVDGIFFGEGEGQVGKLVAILTGPCPPPQPSVRTTGEGEERAPGAGARLSSSLPFRRGGLRGGSTDRRGLLARAAEQVEGFWATGRRVEMVKATCRAPQAQDLPLDYPLLNTSEAHTARLQINYGCPAFCSFCFEAYDRKPYREIPLPDLLDAARRIKRAQGSEALNLYSFNFNTRADIPALLLALHQLYDRVGATSQRVDLLQHTPQLLEAELEADKRSYTLGIEGISARQRAFLHKSLPSADILGLLERLLQSRIREVKLFYILTGHEGEEDVAEFRQFLRDLKALQHGEGRRARRATRMIFSFGLLIRMPFTPLRYDRLFLDEDHWRPLIGQTKSACETNGFEFRLAYDWPTYCTTQVLALGGHWLAEPIIALAREGQCFDMDLPEGYWERLQGWMQREGRWNDAFLGEKGPGYNFAFGFVRSNVPPEFLYQQYQEAQAGVDSGYCLGTASERGHCLACGACASPEQRAEMVRQRTATAAGLGRSLSVLRELVTRKRQLKPIYVRMNLDRRLSGAGPAFLDATVFRGLLAQSPGWTENLLSVRESLFTVSPNDRRFPPLTGETVFALKAWDVAGVLQGRGLEIAATSGVHVVGLAEGFAPGVYTRLQIEMHLSAVHFPEPRIHLETYLREAYLPYSLRREEPLQGGEARYRFDVPSKGLKKKIVFGGAFEIGAQGMDAWLEVGPGFDVLAFLESFGERELYRQARVHVASVEW